MPFQTLMIGSADSFLVDDFFEDPVEVRRQILSTGQFYREDGANYPGYAGRISDALRAKIYQRIEQVIGHRIQPCTAPYSELSVRLQRRGDEKLAKSLVHCDPHRFTAIIYLSPPECVPDGISYGTRIYETKKHGLNTLVYSKIKQSLRDQWTREEFEKVAEECRTHTFDLLYWRMLHDIPFKFNRLSIFIGQRFHCSCPVYFGESNEFGRLTLNFFFELDSTDSSLAKETIQRFQS